MFLVRSNKKMFSILCFFGVVIIILNIVMFFPLKNGFSLSYLEKLRYTSSISREKKPLNEHFHKKFKEAFELVSLNNSIGSMKGVYGPIGLGGTGNVVMGMLNMMIYSLFSDAIFIFPKSLLFNDMKNSFTEYVDFVEPSLEKYAIYPSQYNTEILSKTTHECSSKKEPFETLCLRDNLRSCVKKHGNVKGFGSGDFLGNCKNYLCRYLFLSGDKESIYHRQTGEANFNCLSTYEGQYLLANLFRSKEKTDFLCNTLNLCEGVNVTDARKKCRNRSCYVYGLILLRNVWKTVFKLSEDKFLEMRRKYEDVELWQQSKKSKDVITISAHVRKVFITKRNYANETLNCLIKTIDYATEQKGKNHDFHIILTGDREAVFDVKKMENEINEQKNVGRLSFNKVTINKIEVGDIGLHVVRNSKNSTKEQQFLDLYFISHSDYAILTEGSTFSQIGYFFGDYTTENMFVIPVDRFTDKSFREEYRPCTRDISILNFLVSRE